MVITACAGPGTSAPHHLDAGQKEALDVQGEAEHTDGLEPERLTRKITKLDGATKTDADGSSHLFLIAVETVGENAEGRRPQLDEAAEASGARLGVGSRAAG